MDITANMELAHVNNMAKYPGLRDHIKSIMTGWAVNLNTLIVACFETWAPKHNRLLCSIRFNKSNIKNIVHECIKSNIKWGTEHWGFHQGLVNITVRIQVSQSTQF